MLASRSSSILAGYLAGSTAKDAQRDLGGIHWRATLIYSAGYWAGSTGALLWWGTWLASYSLAGYLAGSTGEPLWRETWLAKLLWRDTGSDPLSCSGGILGGIHYRAALTGYCAGSTGEPLWRDTRQDPGEQLLAGYWRDPLASCSVGMLGGIHW